MNPIFQELDLKVVHINHVAALIRLRVGLKIPPSARQPWQIVAGVYEVGVDGSQPASPCAVATLISLATDSAAIADLHIKLGTPFLASRDNQPHYALRVNLVGPGMPVECAEQIFGFAADGQLFLRGNVMNCLRSVSARPPDRPALFVVGDSTAFCNGPHQRGWGDELVLFFDPARIQVLNRARPGRSTRSYRREGLWQRVLDEIYPGDLVLIQFGHNDADSQSEGRCRGVLPGVGESSQVVCLPDGQMETVLTFGAYLRQFVLETQDRGAQPILLSLTVRNRWIDGKLAEPASDYGRWSASVAASVGIPFLDLEESIRTRYQILGPEPVSRLFCRVDDHVHTSLTGARLNAEAVAAGLKKLRVLPQSLFIDYEPTAR